MAASIKVEVFEKFLTETEEARLMKCVAAASGWQARRDACALRLMRSTGLRVGTLVGLTVADAREGISTGRLVLRDSICKRGKGYPVQVTEKTRAALRGLLTIRKDLGLGWPPDAPLLVSRTTATGGQGMSVRAVQMRVRYWADRAGLAPGITPHWLRHTLGQRLMRNSTAQNPLLIVNRALGHGCLDSTLIYTRPTREDVRLALLESGA